MSSFEIFDHVDDDAVLFDLVRDDSDDAGHDAPAANTRTGDNISTGNGGVPKKTSNSDMDDDIPF